MLTKNEKQELQSILKERYINNRNLNTIESMEECVDSSFFGFGSFTKLKKLIKTIIKNTH